MKVFVFDLLPYPEDLDHVCGELAELAAHIESGGLVEVALGRSGHSPIVPNICSLPPASNHVVALEPAAARVAVPGDRDAAERILVNLLDNAAEYSPAGSRIAVAVRAGGHGPVGAPTTAPGSAWRYAGPWRAARTAT